MSYLAVLGTEHLPAREPTTSTATRFASLPHATTGHRNETHIEPRGGFLEILEVIWTVLDDVRLLHLAVLLSIDHAGGKTI